MTLITNHTLQLRTTGGSWVSSITGGAKMTALSLTAVNRQNGPINIAARLAAGRQGMYVSLLPYAILGGGNTAVIRLPGLHLDNSGLLDLYSSWDVDWTLTAATVDSPKDKYFWANKVPGGNVWMPYLSNFSLTGLVVSNNTSLPVKVSMRNRNVGDGSFKMIFQDEIVGAGKSARGLMNILPEAGHAIDVMSSGYTEWIATGGAL